MTPLSSLSSSLEDATVKPLPGPLPNLLGTTGNARIDFYDKFKREADEYDGDFMKKYNEDLDTTLIFVGTFSGASAPESWVLI